jgi:prolyl oligopeptidase
MHSRAFAHVLLSSSVLAIAAAPALAQKIDYPDTNRVEQVDDYHGTKVEDPYRWLEDDARESKEVAAWIEQQNNITFDYLKSIPQRDQLEKRLTELWDYEKFSQPFKAGGRYYYSRNTGLQNQFVVYMMDTLDGEPRVLFDPNEWSADGTIALAGMAFTDDGRYCAYGKAEAGSDWVTWRVRDLNTNQDLADEVRWVKFSQASWTPDSRGFFYSRYDEPREGAFTKTNEFQKLYYHRVGTPQSEDVLVYHRPDEPHWGFGGTVTEDGRYLVITIWKGTADKYRVMVKDLLEPYGLPVDLISAFENDYSFVGNDGPVFYFKTDVEAPRSRVIAMDIRKPQRENWKELIPQSEQPIQSVNLVGNMFVVTYLKDAVTLVRMFDVAGKAVRDVEFPGGIGSAGGFGGRRADTETFYTFSSFATPPTIFHYDLITGRSTLMRQAKVDFNPADFETRQAFYQSKDGTRVPMFICHRKGLTLDGDNPTLLYGYGGFSISLTPVFSVSRLAWMEMGGVFAMPNLRGGGEYGEDWHQAGTRLNKQNVFDDFIAAAEWLIANGYTQPSKLAIQGGSNGGLLVGACMTQRPDLFGACLPAVGVMDMLRFHKFTIGRAWADDYGNADNPEEFAALVKYSPYHCIAPGTSYPPTLITTADTDDRVVPGHSFKFAAALQYAQAGPAPTLIRIETRAGHGAGKPTAKIIEEVADQWAFLVKNLDVNVPPD